MAEPSFDITKYQYSYLFHTAAYIMKGNSHVGMRRSKAGIACLRYSLLLACIRLIAYPSIEAFQSNIKLHSHDKVILIHKEMYSEKYVNRLTSLKRRAKIQPDDEDDDQEDSETSTNSGRRLSRVRNRVKDLARRMVQVPIHVASSISPMPQAIAEVLKDATLNAVDLAVDEGMYGCGWF